MCVCLSPPTPIRDVTCNPGMCPDWESNQHPFGSKAGAQSTEPHQPGKKEKNLLKNVPVVILAGVAQWVGASSPTPKGCRFNPWSGRIQEAASPCFSLTLMFLSLSLKTVNVQGED